MSNNLVITKVNQYDFHKPLHGDQYGLVAVFVGEKRELFHLSGLQVFNLGMQSGCRCIDTCSILSYIDDSIKKNTCPHIIMAILVFDCFVALYIIQN